MNGPEEFKCSVSYIVANYFKVVSGVGGVSFISVLFNLIHDSHSLGGFNQQWIHNYGKGMGQPL